MRFSLIRVAAGLALLVVAIVASSARPSNFARAQQDQPVARVGIDNFSFLPKEITVPKGTKVTWVNHDDVPHTVVSGGAFRSQALDTDDTFSFIFTEAGSYSYFCSVHPMMVGRVIVK
ncbi:MAG: cupredoxin family copper-binding protein [Candidatus Acidiferrales bacterium]